MEHACTISFSKKFLSSPRFPSRPLLSSPLLSTLLHSPPPSLSYHRLSVLSLTFTGFKTKQLRMEKRELPQASALAKKYSEHNCMEEVKKDWSSERSHEPAYGGRLSYGRSADLSDRMDECEEDEEEATEEAR